MPSSWPVGRQRHRRAASPTTPCHRPARAGRAGRGGRSRGRRRRAPGWARRRGSGHGHGSPVALSNCPGGRPYWARAVSSRGPAADIRRGRSSRTDEPRSPRLADAIHGRGRDAGLASRSTPLPGGRPWDSRSTAVQALRRRRRAGPRDVHGSPGGVFGFLGPNGAGKTTRCASSWGHDPRTRARCAGLGGAAGPRRPRGTFGYLPEERGLYPRMGVLDQLVFVASLHGVPRGEGARRARPWLARFRIADVWRIGAPRPSRRATSRRCSSSARSSTSPRCC